MTAWIYDIKELGSSGYRALRESKFKKTELTPLSSLIEIDSTWETLLPKFASDESYILDYCWYGDSAATEISDNKESEENEDNKEHGFHLVLLDSKNYYFVSIYATLIEVTEYDIVVNLDIIPVALIAFTSISCNDNPRSDAKHSNQKIDLARTRKGITYEKISKTLSIVAPSSNGSQHIRLENLTKVKNLSLENKLFIEKI